MLKQKANGQEKKYLNNELGRKNEISLRKIRTQYTEL